MSEFGGAMQAEGKTTNYRPDVDGLRAVAILPVLLYHAGVAGFPGGFVGVDVFFVISGYVIALSIGRELAAGRFTIAGFYERRMRRILPGLMIVLGVTFLISLFIVPPYYFQPFARSLVYASGFAANHFFWTEDGYFGSQSPFRPLLHTWSLGVEEQYYIIVPLLLLLVFRYFRQRWAWVLVPLLLLSLAGSIYATTPKYLTANFFSLPTRAWELLLGALIALAPPPMLRTRALRELAGMLAIALIASAVFLYKEVTPFPGIAALAPCLGTALLIYLGTAAEPPVVSRVLAWRPLVFVGLLSYALYLVHWPLIVIAEYLLARHFTGSETVLAVAACFIFAMLLHYLIERPLRHVPASRAIVFGLSFIAIIGAGAAGLLGPRLNAYFYKDTAVASYWPDWDRLNGPYRVGTCMLRPNQTFADWNLDGCVRSSGGGGGDILLWGDSFAAHYAPGVEKNAALIDGRVIQYTLEGCPPVLSLHRFKQPHCDALTARALSIITENKIKRVVIAAAWSNYLDRRVVTDVDSTLAKLQQMGVETTVIGQSPMFFMDPLLIEARFTDPKAPEYWSLVDPRAAEANAALRRSAERRGATFIDPLGAMCRGTDCVTRRGGEELFLDFGHYTPEGSVRAVKAYFPYVNRGQIGAAQPD